MSQPTEAPLSPLVAGILTAMNSQTAAVTNNVIDNLTEQLADANATLDAIRDRIQELLSGPYMPLPGHILTALWPTAEQRAEFRELGHPAGGDGR